MPLYEYKCLKCEKIHEVMQKFSDAPLEQCPDCDGSVTKLVSLSSFSLKGTGWYTTDYKKSSSAGPSVSSPAVSPTPAAGTGTGAPGSSTTATAPTSAAGSGPSTPSDAGKKSPGTATAASN